MSFWIFKCNDKGHEHQVQHGDWNDVFSERLPQEWGSAESIKADGELEAGDLLIAYQTDRNEVVGLVEVVKPNQKGKLYVRPIEEYRVRLLPLKKQDERIGKLGAFAQGKIATIYSITTADAWHLLNVVKAQSVLQQVLGRASTN